MDFLALAVAECAAAKMKWDDWLKEVRTNTGYNYKNTHWYKAGAALEANKNQAPPTPPPAPKSPFAGKGVFTTSEPASGLNHGADWVASQMDPEGGPLAGNMMWMARPTQEMATRANALGVPFIAQAENQPELDIALSLHLSVPKALIGNPHAWTKSGFDAAAAGGWDLILEWYKNAHPWETAPDAANYPRFVNVCFGIYGEGEPGGQGYVPQIPLSEYRAVWHGSFSVWKAESMTPADWASFAA